MICVFPDIWGALIDRSHNFQGKVYRVPIVLSYCRFASCGPDLQYIVCHSSKSYLIGDDALILTVAIMQRPSLAASSPVLTRRFGQLPLCHINLIIVVVACKSSQRSMCD